MNFYNGITSFLTLVSIMLITACDTKESVFDLEKERQEILRIQQLQRSYHFNKDSVAFAESQAADMISVNRGSVSYPTREENIQRYNNYFSSVEFIKWDDTSEPVIRFSPDGKLAYSIVEKEVVLEHEDDGKTIESTTNYAWVAIYRKGDGGWKIECVASTNKPTSSRELP